MLNKDAETGLLVGKNTTINLFAFFSGKIAQKKSEKYKVPEIHLLFFPDFHRRRIGIGQESESRSCFGVSQERVRQGRYSVLGTLIFENL